MTTFRYRAFGLDLLSELELPDFEIAPESRAAGIEIRIGQRPQTARFEVEIPGLARFFLAERGDVIIERSPAANPLELNPFLTQSVLPAALLQNRSLPLRACAVGTSQGAIVFAGVSGRGKSTLAAALEQRGWPVVSDELCAISVDPKHGPVVHRGPRTLHLWPDAMKALGLAGTEALRVREAIDLRRIELSTFSEEMLPVKRVFWLRWTESGEPSRFEFLESAADRLGALVENTAQRRAIRNLDLLDSHLELCAQIAGSIRVDRWFRTRNFDALSSELDLLAQQLETDG